MKGSKKKIRKGFKVNLWPLFFVVLIPTTLLSSEPLEPHRPLLYRCDGPTNLAQVIVKQERESPPTYNYEVKNLHKLKIIAFTIGDSDHVEMESISDNIPKTITSPKSWNGQTNFKEESIYMDIRWRTSDPASDIAPGKSLGGFKIEMPEPSERKVPLFNVYGEPSESLDMKKAPFRVFFEDGSCLWGRVQEEK